MVFLCRQAQERGYNIALHLRIPGGTSHIANRWLVSAGLAVQVHRHDHLGHMTTVHLSTHGDICILAKFKDEI